MKKLLAIFDRPLQGYSLWDDDDSTLIAIIQNPFNDEQEHQVNIADAIIDAVEDHFSTDNVQIIPTNETIEGTGSFPFQVITEEDGGEKITRNLNISLIGIYTPKV